MVIQIKMTKSAIDQAIDACSFSDHYARMYEDLTCRTPLRLPPDDKYALSKALFYHLAHLRYVGWKHAVDFQRDRRHGLSDVFQDLLAYYLRKVLGAEGYDVALEASREPPGGGQPTRVDILISKELASGAVTPFFIIEVKTTVGYKRIHENEAVYLKRLSDAARNFGVPEKHAIYIFEEPSNNGNGVEQRYWTKGKGRIGGESAPGQRKLPRPTEGLFSHIYPLFFGTDPKTWNWMSAENPTRHFANHKGKHPIITKEMFLAEAERRLVTPLEDVIDLIRAAGGAVT